MNALRALLIKAWEDGMEVGADNGPYRRGWREKRDAWVNETLASLDGVQCMTLATELSKRMLLPSDKR